MRIPYGLDRLPRDVTLRSVKVGDAPLRLNSEPVPADAMPLVIGDHAARVAAAIEWLESQCGDYAPLRRRFISAYFQSISNQIEACREELVDRLKPFDGLYAPEDFLWSALRPLPRGWVPVGDQLLPADIVFWTGVEAIAVELSPRETDKERVLLKVGVTVRRIDPTALDNLNQILPPQISPPFAGTVLPASPFRRAIPRPA